MSTLTQIKATYAIIFLIIGLLVGYGFARLASGPSTPRSEASVLKIGFVGPLTGENANIGIPISRGMMLAIDEVNANGGINGRQLEAVYEDGKCNAKDATTAVRKLLDQDRVIAIVGGVCSSETLAMAPIMNEAKIVLASPSSTNPAITTAGDYVFRVVGSDALQGKIMADYIKGEGYTKAAVIYQNSDYNLGLKNVFADRFLDIDGKVVAAETYEQDAKDFRVQLTKIKAANPEAMYIVPYSEGGLIVKQIKELGITAKLFGPETFESRDILKAGGNALEGFVFTKPRFDSLNPASKAVLQKYAEKHGAEAEFPAYMTNAYDVVMLFAESLRKNADTNFMKDFLYAVKDYNGAGGKLTIDQNGDAIKDFQFMIIKNGKFEQLREG